MNQELPAAILIAVDFMRKSFGGTDVQIISDLYRSRPTQNAPAGELGCDIEVKLAQHDMEPVKSFLSFNVAENMAFSVSAHLGGAANLSQAIADEIVFALLKPEYDNIVQQHTRKEKINKILP